MLNAKSFLRVNEPYIRVLIWDIKLSIYKFALPPKNSQEFKIAPQCVSMRRGKIAIITLKIGRVNGPLKESNNKQLFHTGACAIKLFKAINIAISFKARVFATTIHFHLSPIFASKAGAYLSTAPYGNSL
jgi:hypothetical protein